MKEPEKLFRRNGIIGENYRSTPPSLNYAPAILMQQSYCKLSKEGILLFTEELVTF